MQKCAGLFFFGRNNSSRVSNGSSESAKAQNMKMLKYMIIPALAVGLAIVSANASEEAAAVASRHAVDASPAALRGE